MIGKFYDYLFEIGDRYAKEYGRKSFPVEIVHEITDALHRAYDEGQENKILVSNRPPESLEEVLAFGHERVTPYIDPDDGQLMFELCIGGTAYKKHCDTAYEVVTKIVNNWDRGWKQADRLQEKLDDAEIKIEKLRNVIAKLKAERRSNLYIEKALRDALRDYADGKEVMVFQNGDITTAVSVGSLLDGKRFLVNDKDEATEEKAEPVKQPKAEPPKAPKVPKKPKEEPIQKTIISPTAQELIQEDLDQLSERSRELVQPLSETEAEIVVRWNNPYRMSQKKISQELGLSPSTICNKMKDLEGYFGVATIKSREVPFLRRREVPNEEA